MREGYKKTEVGVIPEDWEVVTFETLYEEKIRDFGSFSTTKLIEYVDEGIPYLRSENFRGNNLNYENVNRIPQSVDELLDKSYVYKDNILFTKIGNIGSAYCYKGELGERCNSNATIAKIKVDKEKVINEYIVYFLISNICKKQYLGDIVSTPPRINMGVINKFKIILPSLKEQEKIAEILSTVDSQIDDTEKLIEKSKELKKGLMQKLLTKGIGHSEFKKTEVGEIPASWEVKKLKDIANIRRGASPRPIKDPKWFSDKEEIGWIRISDVTSSSKYLFSTTQYLSEEGKNKSRFVKDGDLIMSICATVGKPIIIKMNACIHDGFVLLDEIDTKIYDKGFLYYVLQRYEESFKSMGQTGTQSNLNTELVGGLKIAVPSIKEQLKISDLLSSIDNRIEEYENKKQKLEELKKGLMQQLLTGKVRTV